MKRKTLALLLAMMMLLTILDGCAKTGTTTDQNDVQDTPAMTDQQGTDDTTDTPDDTQTNEDNTNDEANTEEPAKVTYPLTEEPVTFTVWWPNELTSATNDYNDRIWFQTMEAKAGVHLDFSASPSSQAASESYNLMLVSGDVSDFVYQIYKHHLKGLDNAVEEDWYYDMVNYSMGGYGTIIHTFIHTFEEPEKYAAVGFFSPGVPKPAKDATDNLLRRLPHNPYEMAAAAAEKGVKLPKILCASARMIFCMRL